MKEEIRELLADKVLKFFETIEDFEQERITFMRFVPRIKELALEIQAILDKAEFMNKH